MPRSVTNSSSVPGDKERCQERCQPRRRCKQKRDRVGISKRADDSGEEVRECLAQQITVLHDHKEPNSIVCESHPGGCLKADRFSFVNSTGDILRQSPFCVRSFLRREPFGCTWVVWEEKNRDQSEEDGKGAWPTPLISFDCNKRYGIVCFLPWIINSQRYKETDKHDCASGLYETYPTI